MQQMILNGKLLEKRYGLISGKEEQSKREKRKEHKLLELPENNVVSKGNLCNRE